MENRILKDLFALFTIATPTRYTQSQIDKAIAVISNYCESKKIPFKTFKKKQDKRTYTSLLINSPENKNKILIAALDTPSMGLLNNKYDYLDNKENLKKKRNSLTISIVLSILIISCIIVLTLHANLSSNSSKSIFVIIVGLIVLLSSWISSEHAVRHNEPNDCALDIAMKLLENHPDIGLILVDGFYQNVGISFLLNSNKWLQNKHCIFIGEIDTSARLCTYANTSPQLANNALSQFKHLIFYAMTDFQKSKINFRRCEVDFNILENMYQLLEKEL